VRQLLPKQLGFVVYPWEVFLKVQLEPVVTAFHIILIDHSKPLAPKFNCIRIFSATGSKLTQISNIIFLWQHWWASIISFYYWKVSLFNLTVSIWGQYLCCINMVFNIYKLNEFTNKRYVTSKITSQ
jgi:hypothetical protein